MSQLAEVLPITRQAVTRHIHTLEEAGLVVGTKRGREQQYRIDLAPVNEATSWLTARAQSWDRALGRLASHLEANR